MSNSSKYVLITPVKDEEALIGETIASVVGQSLLPLQWVIVSDGSTDCTEEIVKAAVVRYPWIRLVVLPPRSGRSFAAVVNATETGVKALTVSDYHYIGLLDSDVRFRRDYFEEVVQRFEACPGLGLAGGMVVDFGRRKDRPPRNLQDVPGASQFFRRQCFEELGGLFAIPEGGWDTLTCVRARSLGYETRLFTDLVIDHLKPRNIAEGGLVRRSWQMGIRDYAVGNHAIFEIFKCLGLLKVDHPVAVVARLFGYCKACLGKRDRLIPHDMVRFIQSEQICRLRKAFGMSGRVTVPGAEASCPHADSVRSSTDG